MTPLSSVHNPRVKAAAKLRDARSRRVTGRFLIDGRREIDRALLGGVRILELYLAPDYDDAADGASLAKEAAARGADVFLTTAPVFEKIAYGERNDGVVAVAQRNSVALADLPLPAAPFVAVVEGVEKPGNFGAILRSADGAGVSAVIAADPRTDLDNPNAIRASLGTIFTLPIAVASADDALDWLIARGLTIYAADPDAERLYTEVDLRPPAAVVLGAEAEGLSPRFRRAPVVPLRLPMLGAADSLNVSVAAAVLFYEALRQRSGGPKPFDAPGSDG